MLEPSLVVIAEVLFDERQSLRIEIFCLAFPLLTLLLTLRSRLADMFLILHNIVVNGRNIYFGTGTQAKKHQYISYKYHSRVSQSAIVIA